MRTTLRILQLRLDWEENRIIHLKEDLEVTQKRVEELKQEIESKKSDPSSFVETAEDTHSPD